ncbi:MAG: hypothetical protein AAF570_27305, partial [Bacteroidota bacterium]
DDISLYLKRGFLNLELENNQEAIRVFTQAIKVENENGTAWYGLGTSKYEEGNIRGACNDWKRGLELGETRAIEKISQFCQD